MSEKSSRNIRSKIPLYQGSRTTSAKTKSLDPRKVHLKQSGNVAVKPGSLTDAADADKHEKLNIDRETAFEPDPQALDSILSNKGISFGAARASEMTPSAEVNEEGTVGNVCEVDPNRLSMWESLNEFKQNLRQYKDSFQQWNTNVKTELKPGTPTSNCNKSAALTPRSCRTLSEPAQMSLMQSYEQHKENIKIFREKMKNIDSALLAPRPPGHHVYGDFTPTQRQSGLTTTKRTTSSATPMNGHVRRAWTELKENRPPHERMKKPGTLSTSKVNPSKLYAIDETSPAGKDDLCFSGRQVRRALLLSSSGNDTPGKHAAFNCYDTASKEYYNSVQPAAVSLSVKEHLMQPSLYSNSGSESSVGLPTTGGLVFKSPDIIQVSRIIPIFLTPKSPFPSGMSNAVSSTDCTWSCQQTLCTPRLKTSERVHETTNNTQTLSTSTADSLKLLNYNTQAVTGLVSTPAFLQIYRTTEDSKTAWPLPLSAAGELSDHFNKLLLNSNPTRCTAAYSQCHVSVPKLWQGSTPSVLTALVVSTPVRAFHGNTFMSNSSSMTTNGPQSAVTPLAQMSCLKNNGLTQPDNTDGLPMRYPVSSVKKLRWADNQS